MGDRRDGALRVFCLCLIVFQNCSLILVTSYSRQRHLEPAYLPSVAVFLAEVLKLAASLVLLALESPGGLGDALRRSVALLRETPLETAQFAVPALAYTLQNNLWYYALTNLEPVTAAVTSQLKVITTAVASVVMLGRQLSRWQWCALVLLMGGMVVMQLKNTSLNEPTRAAAAAAAATTSPEQRRVPQNTTSGAVAMLGSTMLSAYAGVYIERLFKTVKKTLWLQSVQLSIFSLPISAGCMLAFDHEAARARTLLVGFRPVVWLAISLSALGGIAVSMALKYADNIQKTFAVGISIVLNCALSVAFLGVALHGRTIAGVAMVVGSTVWFNRAAPSSGGSGSGGHERRDTADDDDVVDLEETDGGGCGGGGGGYREVALDHDDGACSDEEKETSGLVRTGGGT